MTEDNVVSIPNTEPLTLAEPGTPVQPTVISKYFQATDSLGKNLMRILLEHIRSLPEQWQKISEKRQEELLESLGDSVHAAVQHGARQLMAAGFPHVSATLDSVTIKDGVKATVIFDRSEADIDAISHQVKRQLVLVLVDPERYATGVYEFEADADQPNLPLGEPPASDAPGNYGLAEHLATEAENGSDGD